LTKEDPGGEAPSAATPAQAAQKLRSAWESELTRAQELADALASERTQAKKLAPLHKSVAARNQAQVKLFATYPSRVTNDHYVQLGGELRGERELALALDRARVRVQELALAQVESQARAQALERALARAMAQARTLERQQAQARSPRLRAIAVGRFLWRLLQARPGLWGGIIRNLCLGMRVVGVLVWMLPKADRDRWRNESYNELEELKLEGAPLLGNAVRIALRTPRLALELWAGAWSRSPAARWLPRLKPVWIGVGTATATFWTGIAGIGQHPTEWQTRKLVAASLLTGVVALTGSFKGQRPRRRSRRRRKR
jgi:hypothetical protein